ncbi:MAG: type II toxin-antitoxin system VapC family toxin [Chloroflexi bacterium]|nr:type II toxin-antitoxin system VapC family toxin [Chloroflexota bacterium]
MRFLDANIFLRYLAKPATPADQAKLEACSVLFQRIKRSEEQVTTTEAIVAEVVYVLISPRHYHLSHQDAAARIRPLLVLRRLKLPHKRAYLRALDLFATHNFLDFEDALIIAQMERQGLTEVYSYDTDLDRLPGISRFEPLR